MKNALKLLEQFKPKVKVSLLSSITALSYVSSDIVVWIRCKPR